MLKYASDIKFIMDKESKKIIILNRSNGIWIKIPLVWKEVLDNYLNQLDDIEEYIKRFEDKDNSKTFVNLVNTLKKYNMVVASDQNSNFKLHKVQFAITERCNLFCTHCCYNAKEAKYNTDLPLDKIKIILDKIIACNPESITISGGEPLIRKDFFEILTYLSQNYFGEITLSTNATLINDKNIPKLAKIISSYDISLDGFDEISCEKIRGKNIFSEVISNIKKMKEYGIKNINVSMVDINHSEKDREKFKKLNNKLGTRPIIRALSPIGRASTIESKVDYMKKLYTPREIDDSELKEICAGFRGTRCGAYKNQFFVDYNGDVYPCGLLINSKYKMCNLLNIKESDVFPFDDVNVNSLKNLNMLEPDKLDKCKDCKVNFFCWNCLQEVDMLSNNSELINERCKLKYEHISNIIWNRGE